MVKVRIDEVRPSLLDHNYIERLGRVEKLKKIFFHEFRRISGDKSETQPTMLLDLGCGRSPYKRLADGFAVKWIAADIRNSGGADILLDAQKLPFKDKVFDTVLCTQILEYLPDFFVASEEIHRILKPQGMAIISNPAVLPPFGGARWRIMPEGYMTMLSKFSVCEVDGDCKTVAGFFRIINLYMAIILQEVPVLEAIWRLSICPIFNLIGSWANRRFKDVGFAANYIVIARK